jgi:hypothetical protein
MSCFAQTRAKRLREGTDVRHPFRCPSQKGGRGRPVEGQLRVGIVFDHEGAVFEQGRLFIVEERKALRVSDERHGVREVRADTLRAEAQAT